MLVEFSTIVLPLSTALGLSLVVERAIEFLKNIFGFFTLSDNLPVQPDYQARQRHLKELDENTNKGIELLKQESKAESIAELLDKTNLDENDPEVIKLKEQLKAYQDTLEWDEDVPANMVSWQAATSPSGERIYTEVAIHAIGLALGIILATISELKLFGILLGYSADANNVTTIPIWLDYLFTGLLISAGSGPIHVLIRFISERKILVAPDEINVGENKKTIEETTLKFTPGADSPAKDKAFKEADWIPIAYEGGVDREKLQLTHRRRNNPNCIIYHHTAMRRDSTFEDVVRVIKNKDWLTGYNCVITEDGEIHPFCRWDRFGSHAAGYNGRSLGIAFNGNFETSKSDSYSNHDGRYGPAVPSQIQLESAARVIALWVHLYDDIKLTFDVGGCIFPHRQIAAKNCPGRELPKQEFYDLIKYYHDKWQNSPVVLNELIKYKRKPYLYK